MEGMSAASKALMTETNGLTSRKPIYRVHAQHGWLGHALCVCIDFYGSNLRSRSVLTVDLSHQPEQKLRRFAETGVFRRRFFRLRHLPRQTRVPDRVHLPSRPSRRRCRRHCRRCRCRRRRCRCCFPPRFRNPTYRQRNVESREGGWGCGGSISQWLTYLLSDPAAP